MVALDWTTADLQVWEEEQRKKKEEEERLRKEAEAEAARLQAEEEAAANGTTAPVYGSPQLAPAQAYVPPVATGLTSVAQAAPDTAPPPSPVPEATGIVSAPAEAALAERGGTYVSQGTPMDAQPADYEQMIYAQRQEPAYESTATATNWVTNTEQANIEAPKKKGGGLLGVIGDVAEAVGDVPLNAVQALPVVGNIVTAGRTAVNAVPGRDVDTVGDAARLAATDTDIPGYSDIARNYLIPGVAGAANAQNPLTWFDNPLRGLAEGASNLGANVAVPVTARDVALTAIPAGYAAKQGGVAAGLAEAFGPGLTRVSPLEDLPAAALRRSVTEVPQNAPEALRVADTAGQVVTPRVVRDTAPLGIRLAGASDDVATTAPSFPRLADESDFEYAVRLRTSGFAPADIKAIEQANAQKVDAQIAQEQADRSTMYQKVGHDTKVVRTRAEQISQRMDALKAEPKPIESTTWLHGTRADFTDFRADALRDDTGVFFTSDPDYAKAYTTTKYKGAGGTPRVIAAQVTPKNAIDMNRPADASKAAQALLGRAKSLQNPEEITPYANSAVRTLQSVLDDIAAGKQITDIQARLTSAAADISRQEGKGFALSPIREELTKLGYDAMRIPELTASGKYVDSLVAFDPSIIRQSKGTQFGGVLGPMPTKRSEAAEAFRKIMRDETGSVRLPERAPAPPPKVYEVGASDAGAKQLAFGEGFTADNPSALSRFAENVKAIPGTLKAVQTSGDVYGFQFRQGAPSLFIDPKAWGRNFSRMGKAYLEDPEAVDALKSVQVQPRFTTGEVLKDVIDAKTGKPIVIKPMAEVLDQFQTPGMEKVNDSLIANLTDRVPLAKRSEKAMRVGYLGLANDLRNSMIDDAIRAGVRDQSWFDHYDDIAKVTVGYGDVPKTLKGLSNGFYSLRNIAARFQMMTKPFTEPGPLLDVRLPGSSRAGAMGGIFSASPRGVSARNLTRFAAGEIANLRLLAFAGEQSGLFEVGWNPLESGFGSLQFGDGEGGGTFSVDLLGGWSSYIKMLSKTAAAAAGDTRFDPFEEQVKFWRYKAGPAASMVIDTLVDVTSLGDLEAFDSPFAKPVTKIMDWKPSDFAEMFSPFFVGAAIGPLVDGVLDVKSPTDLAKVAGLLSATWGGAPANYYEPSVFTLAPEIFDGREFTELDGAERAVVNQALLQQGGKLEGWQRVQPYDRADDDGFEAIKARTPELQQYKDLKTFRAEMERAIIQEATARGITLESQDVDTKRKALEKKLGLPGETDPRHALVVAIDPEIISQMQAMYDSGERTFPPSKEMRTFADKVKAMSDADRKELIRQLEERLDAAP